MKSAFVILGFFRDEDDDVTFSNDNRQGSPLPSLLICDNRSQEDLEGNRRYQGRAHYYDENMKRRASQHHSDKTFAQPSTETQGSAVEANQPYCKIPPMDETQMKDMTFHPVAERHLVSVNFFQLQGAFHFMLRLKRLAHICRPN